MVRSKQVQDPLETEVCKRVLSQHEEMLAPFLVRMGYPEDVAEELAGLRMESYRKIIRANPKRARNERTLRFVLLDYDYKMLKMRSEKIPPERMEVYDQMHYRDMVHFARPYMIAVIVAIAVVVLAVILVVKFI